MSSWVNMPVGAHPLICYLQLRPPRAPTPTTYAPYNPAETEAHWYDFWVEHACSGPSRTPTSASATPFVITMPPPNVTGDLHIGHTLFVTLEDIMIRWHRMLGDPTLWVPGRDHAGIAGQLVVERSWRSRGLTRHDLGREKFLDQIWEWMETLRPPDPGASCASSAPRPTGRATCSPWTRTTSRAVRTAFVRLYDKGLIYRGQRIANWCQDCQTVLSDLEVEYQEVQGTLTVRALPGRPTRDGESIAVATTRPETILGDIGVAVHPDDQRYAHLVGKHVRMPHVESDRRRSSPTRRSIPSSAPARSRSRPRHDPTDFEIGQRHDLPAINVMNLDGTMNEKRAPTPG